MKNKFFTYLLTYVFIGVKTLVREHVEYLRSVLFPIIYQFVHARLAIPVTRSESALLHLSVSVLSKIVDNNIDLRLNNDFCSEFVPTYFYDTSHSALQLHTVAVNIELS